MSATKFPLVDRYELFDRKIFYDKEILEKKDFYNKVVVVNENDKLVLQEKKIFPIQYLCIDGSCFDNSDSCWIYKKKMNESPIFDTENWTFRQVGRR